MDKLFSSNMSIERLAAYLDGNLSANEMQSMSSLIGEDDRMRMIVDASSVIDDTNASYTACELELPSELQSLDFVLPNLDTTFSGITTLSPESEFEDSMAFAAFADIQDGQYGGDDFGNETDNSTFLNDSQNGHATMGIENTAGSLDMNIDEH